MNQQRRKKSKSEIVVLIGTAMVFVGLVVMLVGMIVAGDDEEIGSLIVLFVGLGIFTVSIAAVCVASVYVRRGKRKALERVKAALPENAVLLPGGMTAHFTEAGLRLVRDDAFSDFAPVIAYSELVVYCRCLRKSSRAKGKEIIFLFLPAGLGAPFSEEENQAAHASAEGEEANEIDDEGGNLFAVGEEVLPLANRHGVKVVDRRHPPVKKLTFRKKFIHRFPEQRKIALRWTFISVAAFAAVLGLCILLSLYTQYGSSGGIAGGLSAGVITPCILSAARNWKKNVLAVYGEGISLSTPAGKCFLFWEEIIRIEDRPEGIFFDCGGIGAGFPRLEGAVEYLREMCPEKFQESI